MDILEGLLKSCNDGRRKGFFCITVNLLDLCDVKSVMERIYAELKPDATLKEKAAVAAHLFNEMAAQRGIILKLRKKTSI
jgi:hypothetical protein